MSEPVGDRLPDEVMTAFDGENLESKIGPAYLLLTADRDGTPRPCMLSAGEILAVDDRTIRVALWATSTTSGNLARGDTATLCYVAPRTALYIKGRPRRLEETTATRLARFEIDVESVESDVHEGMPVSAPVRFTLEGLEPAKVVESWRRQIGALREGA